MSTTFIPIFVHAMHFYKLVGKRSCFTENGNTLVESEPVFYFKEPHEKSEGAKNDKMWLYKYTLSVAMQLKIGARTYFIDDCALGDRCTV